MTNSETQPVTTAISQDPVPDLLALTQEEILEIKRITTKRRDPDKTEHAVPELEITDEDRDSFAESIESGVPFTRSFSKLNGRLEVTFRVRTKREDDAISLQLIKDFNDKLCQTTGQFNNRINSYNLLVQMTDLNGAPIAPLALADLRKSMEQSVLETMAEPKLYILISLLFQFDNLVVRLCREAYSPSFT